MKIISLVHQKGGVGKSTIALNLAYAFGKILQVGVCDIDPQGSINNLVPEGITILNSVDSLKDSASTQLFDLIIIDTPPYLTSQLHKVFGISDLIIIPTKPGVFDTLAIMGTIDLLKESECEHKTRVLFNMVKHNSNILESIFEPIQVTGIDVLKNHITERVDYVRSVLDKGIVNSQNIKAKSEFENLCSEIIDLIYE